MIKVVKVKNKVLRPEGGSLSDGRGLCRLKMGVGKRRNVLILLRKIAERGNRVDKQLLYYQKPLAHLDDIGVVADIAGRRTEMDDRLCSRAGIAEGPDVSHDIVAELRLVSRRFFIVNVVDMSLHLVYLRICYVKSQLFFALGKGDPQLSPCRKLVVRRKDPLHRIA